ncbi:type VI secretion protein [Streptomyces sp. MI02-7b]|uniref:type IV secretory system conjugative DNA transfer family protein n=1 Tax=Streptomyces sp. MI02-7b TaxID=462941 RepID=UPI0029A546DF|nr:type VI secretion protein [Streptomyces sp. MI02-7b]MDX3076447.1 type VI secretion protein [Streptomyces sp. MI02-7b]
MARQQHSSQEREGGIPDGLILGVIGFLLGMTILVWTGTGIAGLLSHRAWPADVHFTRTPLAMRHLIAQPHDIAGAWAPAPPAGLPGSGLFWGVFIGQLMVLFVLTVFVMGTIARTRLRRAARRAAAKAAAETAAETAPGQGSAPLVPRPARQSPTATAPVPAPSPAVDPAADTDPAPVRAEPPAAAEVSVDRELTRTYAVFAPQRGDKGKRLVQPAVLNAAGPVVVTTADPDTFHQTVGNRAKLGPVHVFDPAHLVDTPARLRWAPHTGCEDVPTAITRSRALLFPVRPRASLDAALYDAAETLLRCWLHAAAVDGQPFRQVHRWAGGSKGQDAVRILRTHTRAAPGWSGELESVLHAHADRRDAAQALVHRALESLNSVHIRDACNPGRADSLDLESFLTDLGTLYVVGELNEDPRTHPGAMPLLTALVSSVVEHGRRMAARSPAGRLDPPLTLVLDDVAALAPVPELPDLLATGSSTGLPTLAVLRSPEQARDPWRSPVWQRADKRLVLGTQPPALLAEIPDAVQMP